MKYRNIGYSIDGERIALTQFVLQHGLRVHLIKENGSYKKVSEDELLAFVNAKAAEAQKCYDESKKEPLDED